MQCATPKKLSGVSKNSISKLRTGCVGDWQNHKPKPSLAASLVEPANSRTSMSRQINQPINQVRLTNVAVVRFNQGGNRFEIACYRNKVVDYRQGLEQDLSEVLQSDRIFSNVSKGRFAKANDLLRAFGTKDEQEISKIILSKGQLQVSDKERTQQLDKTNAQIADWVVKHCVNPQSNRPYTISQIRHAMQQANFAVHPTKPLKRQYLDCIKILQSIIPIQRAKMELKLTVPDSERDAILKVLQENDAEWSLLTESTINNNATSGINATTDVDTDASLQSNTISDVTRATSGTKIAHYKALVDPSLYRLLNDVLEPVEGGKIEVLVQVVTQLGESNIAIDKAQVDVLLDDNVRGSIDVNNDYDSDLDGESDNKSDDGLGIRAKRKKNKKKQQKLKKRAANMAASVAQSDQHSNALASIVESRTTVPATKALSNSSVDTAGNDRKSCNTCGGSFGSAAEYRTHFKSDWHRYNQKLKLKGLDSVSEEEFKLVDAGMFESNL